MKAAALVTGARAVIWWQGETDAKNGMDQATYNAYLDTMANQLQADLGVKIVACKLEDMSTYQTGYNEEHD